MTEGSGPSGSLPFLFGPDRAGRRSPSTRRPSCHSSQVRSTSRALDPWLGPDDPRSSIWSMSRPARANPTFSLRWSMDVDPSCDRTTEPDGLVEEPLVLVGWPSSSEGGLPIPSIGASKTGRRCLRHHSATASISVSVTHAPWMRTPLDTFAGWNRQIAVSDELLGPDVEDDARVGLGGRHERDPGRDVRLDQARDHVDARPLGGHHQVDADRPGHLGDPADGVLDVAGGDHHEVGQLVDHHHDVREALELSSSPGGMRKRPLAVGGVVRLDVRMPTVASCSYRSSISRTQPGLGGPFGVDDHR